RVRPEPTGIWQLDHLLPRVPDALLQASRRLTRCEAQLYGVRFFIVGPDTPGVPQQRFIIEGVGDREGFGGYGRFLNALQLESRYAAMHVTMPNDIGAVAP